MSTPSPAENVKKLVTAFSDISSTEDLILFVAGNDNMLSLCRELIDQHDQGNSSLLTQEIHSQCGGRGILPGLLYSEIRKVLIALNTFHNADRNHYATLGLPENASLEEVKKTYRELSKKYHPDTAENKDTATQRFMEISGAYHAIMASTNDTPVPDNNPWRKTRRTFKTKRRREYKSFFLGVALLVFVLAGISFYAALKYDEQIMLEQLQASGPPNEPPLTETIKAADTRSAVSGQNEEIVALQQPTQNLEPRTPDLKPRTPDPEPRTPDPEPRTPNLEPRTPDPEPRTPDPEPRTPDPEPPPQVQEHISQPEVARSDAQKKSIPAAMETPSPAARKAVNAVPKPAAKEEVVRETTAMEKEKTVPAQNKRPPLPRVASAPSEKPEPKKVVSPANEPPATAGHDQKEAIKAVLAQYAQLYSAKDLERFLALFKSDATENGNLQSELISQYRSLFIHTDAINLALEDINWQDFKDGYQARGTFKTSYTYKDGRTSNHSGNITFYLNNGTDGRLKIQSLDYVFVN